MKKYYSPKGLLLWDSWFIKKEGQVHLFHLQAKPTGDPNQRHDSYVSIGHAVSTDLAHWQELPTALKPGSNNAWDDLALWTGSTIEHHGKYYMYYTGRNHKPELDRIQKIGLATSADLLNWKKHPGNPILEADNKIYDMKTGRNAIGKGAAWRDPYVFQDPNDNNFYMLIAGRKKGVHDEYNGCIAIAKSGDLVQWDLLPPLIAPDLYDEMEVPQMVIHNGLYYIFFSTHANNYKPEYAKKVGAAGGRHCYYSDTLFGTYQPVNHYGVVYAHENEIYALTFVTNDNDVFTAVGWLNNDRQGKFVGKLSQPIKFLINKDRITVIT